MNTTWIVAADAGLARIFEESDTSAPLRELEAMTNPAARLLEQEANTDKIGPKAAGKSSHGTGGALPNSQWEPNRSFEQHNAERFAKEVMAKLTEAYQQGRFAKLDLIAEPQFLGMLRQSIPTALRPAISQEINKDLIHATEQQVRAEVRQHAPR